MTFVQLENITLTIGKNEILKNIDWVVEDGEFMVLVGPSGCGKTTLLKIILGALHPDTGSVYIDHQKINDTPISERNIGFVPQNFGLFPHLTIDENISYGLKVQKIPKHEIKKRITPLIKTLKLKNLEQRKPNQLSWGQQQRVALARALAIHPYLLLLDEPLSSVDWNSRRTIAKEIQNLQEEFKITVIYVTHDIDEAFDLGHRITVMNEGIIQQSDSPLNLIQNPTNTFVSSFVRQTKSLKRTRMIMDLTSEE